MKNFRAPLLLFVLPVALLAFAPTRQGSFLLDRSAVAGGQAWRLWTGHWVHFSVSHLAWNLVVLLAAGAWLERVRPGLLLRHVSAAAPLIGLTILAAEPALQAYGGLSALATGVVVLLALHQLRTAGTARWVWAGVLALVAIKSVQDFSLAPPLAVDYGRAGIRTSRVAHAAGALVAVLHYVGERYGIPRARPVPAERIADS